MEPLQEYISDLQSDGGPHNTAWTGRVEGPWSRPW